MPIYASLEEALGAMSASNELLPIQQEQYDFHEQQVAQYGQYTQGIDAYGAHYGDVSPFQSEGLICANCVYYGNQACQIVEGVIKPNGICKFWIIPEES